MRVAVTGGTGLVGQFVVRRLVAVGHEVVSLSRRPPAAGLLPEAATHGSFDLGAGGAAALDGVDALVHTAFAHVPGRYRGGEGQDPSGFLSRNLGGSICLFRAAREAGVAKVVFLSSRAVYGDYPPGTTLTEEMEPRPDTLYGHVKREAEAALGSLQGNGLHGVSLRVTGVYGPGLPTRTHKWADLFDAFTRGELVEARAGTEVHGDDLSRAVELCLSGALTERVCNVSDFVLDRVDLLEAFSRITGIVGKVPERFSGPVSVMSTERVRAAGWLPRGPGGLEDALASMCRPWMRA